VEVTHADKQALIDFVRSVVVHDRVQWQHPTDTELQQLYEKRIWKAIETLEKQMGGDGK
jgi:hypothetical protein